MQPDSDRSAYNGALAYVGIGDSDEALKGLTGAVGARMGSFNELNADPSFDSLRADSRPAALLRRMRFPATPQTP